MVDEKYYLNIGEVARKFNVTTSLLRFWETQFKQIKPKKKEKGFRHYNKKNVDIIAKIYFLIKIEHYTIKGAKRQLEIEKKKQK